MGAQITFFLKSTSAIKAIRKIKGFFFLCFVREKDKREMSVAMKGKREKEEKRKSKESNQEAGVQVARREGHATRQGFFECRSERLVRTSDQ